MRLITSTDGTSIALEEHGTRGDGPAAVLLGGAFNDRSRLRPLAEALGTRLLAVTVDRRARGDSTDATATASGAVERELDDVAAIVADLGGSVALVGFSSGAQLALAAAAAGVVPAAVVAIEPPFLPAGAPPRADRSTDLERLVAEGRPDDAVVLFQREVIGMPADVVEGIRRAPFWPALVAIAPSLVYDAAVTARYADPATLRDPAAPVVVVRGRDSTPFLAAAADHAVSAIPGARLELVDGVNHEPDLAQVADVVAVTLGR
ncbi:alpha/beta fold hydrolase [Cellulomonas alba]|uniref:Alpha/beta fold hydrolase n=1 Tax=Cellulomonas alba TaxID=3053467 RepID=A0ABT7SBH0_9CELL|nr:alpha/beta fold hydrolase [Cellulomonas alba]MDM7853486.1 alpha/beta fold hydrolase [Cellulomonas alba]